MPMNSSIVNTYKNLMDSINNGLLLLDSKNNVCISNKWFNRHCEYEMETKITENIYHLFPELKDSRINDAINSTMELGYPSLVSNIFTPTPFPLYSTVNFTENHLEDNRIQQQVTICRLQDDNGRFCLIQITDVTASVMREHSLEAEINERKHIEDALLESDIKNLTIMEKMVDGLIVFTDAGVIESINPASEKLFGYSEASIIGLSVSPLFDTITEKNRKNDAFSLKKEFIGSYHEVKAISGTGEIFDVELSISNAKIGDKTFYTAIVSDITERKNIEKMKTEFISTVSHELRTPLTSIQGSLGLICGGAIDASTEQAANLINIAHSNCDRLILLINDLLDMEKIASGGLVFDIAKHDLRPLITRCIDDNQSYADVYKVNYTLTADRQAFNCDIDSHRFLQIISNLLSNAAKFSKENEHVDIRLFQKDKIIEIQVQDYGEGIPGQFKGTIWNKFTQADASTTRKKGGTGLGLAISRSLAEDMGGNIRFESTAGKGTTFILTFPCSD